MVRCFIQKKGEVEYTYDGEGKRYSKKVIASTGEAISERYYHYDVEGNIVMETAKPVSSDPSSVIPSGGEESQVLVKYVRDNSGKAISMIQGNNTYYFIYNSHGDVTSLTDEQGATVASYTYDEFGNLKSSTGTIYNPLRYSGANNAYYDTETSLYKMGARYYDSSTGRWITRDSYTGEQEEPPSQNRYIYVENDPINGIDPTGNWKAWPEHFKQTRNIALRLGFSNFSATYMATGNLVFDYQYNAVIRPQYHFGRVLNSQSPRRSYRSTRPWKYKKYWKDYRVAYALLTYKKAVFLKRTIVGYTEAMRDISHGLHAIQDIYAHLDATPKQHLNGKYANLYDRPKAMHRGKKWKWWRRTRSRKATYNYLRMFKLAATVRRR